MPDQNCVVIADYLSYVDDDTLVSAARAGDGSAFVELCERHSRKVLPRIYRILKNREDAEDAFQDTILSAFVHIKTFEGRSHFTSWLTRIAINYALMSLGKKREKKEISIEQVCDEAERPQRWEPRDPSETPEARYARRESEQLLRDAIQRLPNKFREVVTLHYARDYSCSDLAEGLGISLSATKTRLMRARTTLRRRLSNTRPRIDSRPTSTRTIRCFGANRKPSAPPRRPSKGVSTRQRQRETENDVP